MNNIENPIVDKANGDVEDKEELVSAFCKLSDDAKAQFYEDCKNGISPEDVRQAMHQKIRQLWGK